MSPDAVPSAEALVGLLADDDRRLVAAALILGASRLDDVTETTGLDVPRAAKALARLVDGGLVERGADGSLVLLGQAFAVAARTAASSRPAPDSADVSGVSGEAAKVLRSFVRDGRLTQIPTARSKRLVVLDRLAQEFEPGRRYPERTVNTILGRWHDDTASLRRYLVDEGLLSRDAGVYWRTGGSVPLDEPQSRSIVTHYERLGVRPSASAEEIRRAYRRLARVHHPDASGAGTGVDMAAVNEAWHVLSDPARRAVYDASLRARPRPAAPPVPGPRPDDADLDDDAGFVPIRHPLARLGIPLPWIIVLGVLALIFVFTAYAVRSSSGTEKLDGIIQIGSCVTVAPDGAVETACGVAHDGRVVAMPPSGTLCDASATGVLDRRTGDVVCVRRG